MRLMQPAVAAESQARQEAERRADRERLRAQAAEQALNAVLADRNRWKTRATRAERELAELTRRA